MKYTERLEDCRKEYPFDEWYEYYQKGYCFFPKEKCEVVRSIFDSLIDELIKCGDKGSLEMKISLFKFTVERLNTIAKVQSELIETEEREELIELFDKIATSAGLITQDSGFDEGIASRWREW